MHATVIIDKQLEESLSVSGSTSYLSLGYLDKIIATFYTVAGKRTFIQNCCLVTLLTLQRDTGIPRFSFALLPKVTSLPFPHSRYQTPTEKD